MTPGAEGGTDGSTADVSTADQFVGQDGNVADTSANDAASDAPTDAPTDAPVDAGPVMCPADAGGHFCGNGTIGSVGTSYECTNGVLGVGTPCTYGCDGATQLCADIVPANQGGATSAGSNGTDGQDWGNGTPAVTPVTTAAQGGTSPSVVSNPGTGGSGGAGTTTVGGDGLSAAPNIGGGAGGGACGAIFLNVPPGAAAPTAGAASPAIKASKICVTSSASCTYP